MRCPVCKQKSNELYDHIGNYTGEECPDGHYLFSDSGSGSDGFFIGIGKRYMNDVYSGSVRKCRIQNMIVKRWVKKERNKGGKKK